MSDKIRKYVLPNLPYLFVFWFFSKIGTAYRIASGADFGTKLMGMLDTFPKAFETYWPGLGGIDLLVGLAGAAGVYLLIQSKIKQAKKFRRDAEYGTARWGTKEDIKPFVDPKFQNNVILTGTEFLTMNTRPKIRPTPATSMPVWSVRPAPAKPDSGLPSRFCRPAQTK